ncbi:MAG: hypothetical protein EXR07_15720 [Acetobacteraceae bacterium]|nr:hypothetical protein [Acetobacteraceae bacterium]
MGAVERATTLNPNSALAWWANGSVNCFENCPDAAIASARRAIRLSPLDPTAYQFRHMLAFGLMLAGHYPAILIMALTLAFSSSSGVTGGSVAAHIRV